ncbi:hypothetical protein RJ639_012684 [Escallonia herrerae]|uniref:Nodule Cysteine-Rich (NCR) secreted peptide n=1 Tax=Escallonia herrerae TaxID=1293975 RepID=A0AA88VLV2_9ASTE|nr:hypothetical protein RJ639_012684 [Escallonia herrerae]
MAMAYTSKLALYLNMAVILSFLLIITMAESRSTPSNNFNGHFERLYIFFGEFKLTTKFFDSINPNINCAAIFVGQWVCVDGTAN